MLTLRLRNCDYLSDGGPIKVDLDRRGAIIGRSPTVDWTLPDPANVISSRHCEIRFDAGVYILRDTSTNGTLVNGLPMTTGQPHTLAFGDILSIGHYEIQVSLPETLKSSDAEAAGQRDWAGWDGHVTGEPTGIDSSDWGRPAPAAAISGQGSLSQRMTPDMPAPLASGGWGTTGGLPSGSATDTPWGAASEAVPQVGPGGGAWGASGAPWNESQSAASTGSAASSWSSAAVDNPAPASARDIWGELAASNAVDWARSGFGVPQPSSPAIDPLGLARSDVAFPEQAFSSPPARGPAMTGPEPSTLQPESAASLSGLNNRPADIELATEIASVLGIEQAGLKQDAIATLSAMGSALRALVGGLVVMLEARARAKAQMGAQTTSLSFEGNNPLKFARNAEQALAQLLNPPERGFMSAQKAVEDAFVDLQSHQVATLKAMQGALRATLDRFSPNAISKRSQAKGLLAQILPGAHDAALWRAYVKEFSGVAEGSDEAFMDVFAKEFRKAYEEQTANRAR